MSDVLAKVDKILRWPHLCRLLLRFRSVALLRTHNHSGSSRSVDMRDLVHRYPTKWVWVRSYRLLASGKQVAAHFFLCLPEMHRSAAPPHTAPLTGMPLLPNIAHPLLRLVNRCRPMDPAALPKGGEARRARRGAVNHVVTTALLLMSYATVKALVETAFLKEIRPRACIPKIVNLRKSVQEGSEKRAK